MKFLAILAVIIPYPTLFFPAILILVPRFASGSEDEDEKIEIVDEDDLKKEEGLKETKSNQCECSFQSDSRFYFVIDESNGVDIKHETSQEDINESLLRIDSGFVWKGKSGKFAAKGEARLDFLVTGKEDEEGDYEMSRSEVKFQPREWFAEGRFGVFDLRFGNQFLRFSRGEVVSPGDLLSPFDLTENWRGELSLPRLPVIALRGDLKLPESLAVTFAFVPFFTQSRYDLFGTDEALLGPGAPEEVKPFIPLLQKIVDPTISDRVRSALMAANLPDEWGPNQSLGIRFEKTSGGLETGLTYLFTFWPIPELIVDPGFLAALALMETGDYASAGMIISDVIERGGSLIRTDYRRVHVFSLDVRTELGPVVIAFESGWMNEGIFPGIDFNRGPGAIYNVKAGIFTSLFQIQYNYEEKFFITGELGYQKMLDPFESGATGRKGEIPPVFYFGEDTQKLDLAMVVKLSLFRDKLGFKLVGQGGILDKSMVISTRISYKFIDRLEPYAGFVFYEVFGERPEPDFSFASMRNSNDEVFFGIRFY